MPLVSSIGAYGPSSGLYQTASAPSALHKSAKPDVFFGASKTSATPSPATPPAEESRVAQFFNNTPVVKNIWAGLKGGFQGTFETPVSKYFGGAAILFGLTLPFALILPGSHFILLPGYVLGRRVLHGLQQMWTGFTDPDKILKPQASPT
jgi:hypothetical protein